MSRIRYGVTWMTMIICTLLAWGLIIWIGWYVWRSSE